MKLYTYDHCPCCVRVRMAFGFKQLVYEHIVLLEDDVANPTRMIGKKMVPILEKDDGSFMPESLDIVRYLDGLSGTRIFAESANRSDLKAWNETYGATIGKLLMPRWALSPLPEFATQGAIDFFTEAKEKWVGPFADCLAATETLRGELEQGLEKLSPMVKSSSAVNEQLSYDDVTLFGQLRGLTIIKGLRWPDHLRAYVEQMSESGDVPLYDDIAEH